MFSADPSHLFEVKRGNDRCVCGQSALSTYIQGNNKGYCRSCSIKRDALVETLTGNIVTDKQGNLGTYILSGIEEMRKQIFAGVLYSMIDEFYAKNEKKCIEPYNNERFLLKICTIKNDLLDLTLKSVQNTINQCSDQELLQKEIYYLYSRELVLMYNCDLPKVYKFDLQIDTKESIDSKIKDIDKELKIIEEQIIAAEEIESSKDKKGKSKIINYIKNKLK